ncbi:kinase-like protein [Favolaschia claudopus]|uniref:Kinase-like protein n=1 Tax=Favolaschia claudopus TaxID=2862362 RepID=A0AAV9ZYJ3_9AGAR
MLPAADSFHPRHAEDFVHTVSGRRVRTPRDMWYPPRPAVELGLDRCRRQVIIKAVAPGAAEARILERLALGPLRDHPDNHTIPIVSILHNIIINDRATFLVHAQWGQWRLERTPCSLSFWAGTQAYQLLQGLAFMHDQGIAHGDLYYGNIVCNFGSLRSRDNPCLSFENFQESGNYRVAFIDFGEARDFGVSGSIQIPCPRPVSGPPADFRAPEIDHCKTFDPFAADVFSMARLVLALDPRLRSDLQKIPEAYRALLNDMGHPDPSVRPSARVALERLESLNRFQTAHQWCAS